MCIRDRFGGWFTITVSAFDSPNISSLIVPDWFKNPYYAPGVDEEEHAMKLGYLRHLRQMWLEQRDKVKDWRDIPEYVELKNDITLHQTTREYVAQGIADWAEKGNMVAWYSRILGEFPPEGEKQLLKREWVMRADRKSKVWSGNGHEVVMWGVDPAGQGEDEFALIGVEVDAYASWETRIIKCEGFHGDDAYDKVKKIIEPYLPVTRYINVDRTGVGEHVFQDLARWAPMRGYDVVFGFVSNGKAFDPFRFKNIKSEAYFHYLRGEFELDRLSQLHDPTLKRQLLSILYEDTQTGQVKMETKAEMRKRRAGSPDRADALAIALWPSDYYYKGGQIVIGA